jgi:hypothetical protein
LCLAQITALHLRLPDLADLAAPGRVEHQDALIKRTRSDDVASRDWDPAKHPRADAPPNPGWFAPKGDGPAAPPPIQVAHAEEEERAPEELLDPVGPVRQAVWDARIALLRRIDPANPSLTYFANPGTPPGPAALGRLNAAIEAAAIKRVADKVMPNGVPIGRRGRGEDIRELPGGIRAAEDLFDFLRVAGTDYRSEPNLKIVKLLGQDAFITYRPVSTSGSPAIDVNIPGYPFIRFIFSEIDLMDTIDRIVNGYLEESAIDHIALPQLASAARWKLGAQTTDEARALALELVRRLYSKGLRPGDYWGGDFEYWPDEGCQAALDRIEREWIEAGADPNLGHPICWFAPRPE